MFGKLPLLKMGVPQDSRAKGRRCFRLGGSVIEVGPPCSTPSDGLSNFTSDAERGPSSQGMRGRYTSPPDFGVVRRSGVGLNPTWAKAHCTHGQLLESELQDRPRSWSFTPSPPMVWATVRISNSEGVPMEPSRGFVGVMGHRTKGRSRRLWRGRRNAVCGRVPLPVHAGAHRGADPRATPRIADVVP